MLSLLSLSYISEGAYKRGENFLKITIFFFKGNWVKILGLCNFDYLLLFRCLGVLGKVITANQACLKWEVTTEILKVYQAIMAWIRLGEPCF